MDEKGMTIARRILFVDDEPRILKGLERMLRPMRHVWTMSFAESGPEALDLLKGMHFDLVVTDIRMPVMNGLQLLSEVKRLYPDIVRIILSGESDRELTMKAINVSHQFLSKPCNTETLKSAISRTGAISDMLQSDSLKSLISGLDSLPSLPALYIEIMQELQSNDSSLRKVGEIISRDVAMTAKILQLVNSSYFCLPRHIASPGQAVLLLGMDTVKSLVLSIQVFSRFSRKVLPKDYLVQLWNHSMMTGQGSKTIARQEHQGQTVIDHSFMAGLLHDSGKLVMASCFTDQYRELLRSAPENNGRSFADREKNIFGVTHAEAGAYLMGLWGLPYPIIEAIAYHHSPVRSMTNEFTPLTSVYIANILEHEASGQDKSTPAIDYEYISSMNLKTDMQAFNSPELHGAKEMRAI